MISIGIKTKTTSNCSKIHLIDELKGLAIILVIISHVCNLIGAPNILRGEVGVDIFLILSGFLLAISSTDTPLKEFIKKKFFRIFPAYWIALVLFIGLNLFFLDKKFSIINIILHITGIHGFFSNNFFFEINQSFWFISLILCAYLLFVLIRKKLGNISLLIFTCGITIVSFTTLFFYTKNMDALTNIPPRLISFFLGIMLGQLYKTGYLELKIELLLGIGFLCFYVKFLTGTFFLYTIAAMSIIIFWMTLRTIFLKLKMGKFLLKAISGIGIISYEIFLFHQPFIQEFNVHVITKWFHVKIPSVQQIMFGVFIGLITTLLLSYITHTLTLKLNKYLFHKNPSI